jgi:PAS domain S-box-containing protein
MIHFSKLPSKNKTGHISETGSFFSELGIRSEQFKSLFDNLPQGVALYKMVYGDKDVPVDFFLLDSNRAYDKIYSPGRERLGKKATEYSPQIENDSNDWLDIYSKVANLGVPETFEVHCRDSNEWYQIYVFSPKKTFLISVFTNITNQKKKASQRLKNQRRAKRALLLAEKRYRRFFETSHDGIMARDMDGKMIDCNKAYAKMLGYTKKELRQLSVQQLLPELWHEQRDKIVKKVLRSGRSIVFEREYKRKDGSVFPASVRTWRLIDPKGPVIGIWSIVRDITEQKDQQKSLAQQAGVLEKLVAERTKQLKDAERLAAIGQTAGMVGHDLRNPLQTVLGELYLAKSDAESLVDDPVKCSLLESIRAIEEQIVYMDKIVSDLQAFVQPVKIDKKPFSLTQLVSSILETVMIPQEILVQIRIPENIPRIKADPQLIKRVLINLVTNAVQAMPEGGRLEISSNADVEDKLLLYVEDSGVGIPDQIKSQIFTPLFTTKPRGQGFGLAVCKRVIEAHGGTIGFKSQVGQGTKFTIQLPLS